MKLSKLIRELSVARDKLKVDPEVQVYFRDTYVTVDQEVFEVCANTQENTILLLLIAKLKYVFQNEK